MHTFSVGDQRRELYGGPCRAQLEEPELRNEAAIWKHVQIDSRYIDVPT